MILKTILASASCLVLLACTSAPTVHGQPGQTPASDAAPVGFLSQDFGTLTLQTDRAGRWLSLQATGTAAFDPNDPRSVDVAVARARTDAYQQIAKFIGNTVQARADTRTSSRGAEIDLVSETRVREQAAALLRGVVFDQVRMEFDRVIVRATTSPQAVGAASQVRQAMQQGGTR